MIYLITGNPGAGKSTVAVQHAIYRYATKGRPVVANFPIDFQAVCQDYRRPLSKASCRVIPDRPSREDLDAIGFGGETEDTAGMLIIDEAGTWLNSRSWNTKDAEDAGQDDVDRVLARHEGGDKPARRARPPVERKPTQRELILDWLTQSRKRYWDVFLIAQSASMLDKQCRDAVCEMVASVRRTDRMRVWGVKLPKMHMASVHYGLELNAPRLERWWYSGKDAQKCFLSYRLFGPDSAHYSVLPATHTRFRGDGPRTQWEALTRRLRRGLGAPVERSSTGPRVPEKRPLVELLMRLPAEDRIRHWRRLDRFGAWDHPLETLALSALQGSSSSSSNGGPAPALVHA